MCPAVEHTSRNTSRRAVDSARNALSRQLHTSSTADPPTNHCSNQRANEQMQSAEKVRLQGALSTNAGTPTYTPTTNDATAAQQHTNNQARSQSSQSRGDEEAQNEEQRTRNRTEPTNEQTNGRTKHCFFCRFLCAARRQLAAICRFL